MVHSRFQEILQELSSAYEELVAQNEAMHQELRMHQKPRAVEYHEWPGPILNVSCAPLDGRPKAEPAEIDEDFLHQLDNMSPPSIATDQDEVSDGESQSAASCTRDDTKGLKHWELKFYEQYQRLMQHNYKSETVTAHDIVVIALEYYPLMEVEHATRALRRFMIHFCDINEEDIRFANGQTASKYMSETSSGTEATEMHLAIPFQVFLCLAKLDMSALFGTQALQDDAQILEKLNRAVVQEQRSHRDSKMQRFYNVVETLLAVVICIDAMSLGLRADDAHGYLWSGIEIAFMTFYIFEIALKVTMRGFRWFLIGAEWRLNLCDLLVVSIGWAELAAANLVRKPNADIQATDMAAFHAVALLGRLARLMRLLRFQVFTELKTMVHGAFVGLKILFWAVVLLVFFIYSLGLVMRSTVGSRAGEGNQYFDSFRSLQWSMFTLFRCLTDGCSADDGTPLPVHLAEEFGVGFMVLYVSMFLFGSFCILNLIMAVFIDYVMVASRRRAQESRGSNSLEMRNKLKDVICSMLLKTRGELGLRSKLRQTRSFSAVRNWCQRATQTMGGRRTSQRKRAIILDEQIGVLDIDFKITRDIFHMWLSDDKFLNLLSVLEINTSNKSELFDVLDSDQSGELEVEEIISGLMHMRGPPQKSDAVEAVLSVRHVVAAVTDLRAKLDTLLSLQNGVAAVGDDAHI